MATDTAKQVSGENEKALPQWLTPLRTALLGRQDERLDYIMDSYFKLSPEARVAALLGAAAVGVLLLAGIVLVYLAALSGLQDRLNDAFEATNKIQSVRYQHSVVKQKFSELEKKLEEANQNLSLISVLENKAKELGLTASGFPPQLPVTELPATNPLSAKYQVTKIDFKVPNVSIKKIMDYVIALESAPHMLKVTSLKIKARYQDKLFFDTSLEVEATVAKK